MGAEQSLQQCKTDCKCEEIKRAYCEGNGDVVQDKPMEVVDVSNLLDTRGKAVEGESPKSGLKKPRRGIFEVELDRTGDHWRTLGLLVSPDDDPKYLIVDDIWEPSLISEWNKKNGEALQVRPGDIIMAVNNQSISGEDMLAKIQASGKGSTLRLQISG